MKKSVIIGSKMLFYLLKKLDFSGCSSICLYLNFFLPVLDQNRVIEHMHLVSILKDSIPKPHWAISLRLVRYFPSIVLHKYKFLVIYLILEIFKKEKKFFSLNFSNCGSWEAVTMQPFYLPLFFMLISPHIIPWFNILNIFLGTINALSI